MSVVSRQKSVTISRPNYEHYTDTAEKLARQVNLEAVRQGAIRIERPTLYDLARAADAHRDLESRRTIGSLVLTV
jgi:NADPH:quinone reductase